MDLLRQLLDGLTLGAPYALIAAGYAIAWPAARSSGWARADVLTVVVFVLLVALARLAAWKMADDFAALDPSARRIAVILAGVAAIAGTMWFRRATGVGLAQRAFEQDAATAMALGIDPKSNALRSAAMAVALAALGGVLLALRGGGAFANPVALGFAILGAAMLGGLGSFPRAIAGGVLIGIADSAWTQAFGFPSRDTALFAALVIVLAFRPSCFVGRTSAGNA